MLRESRLRPAFQSLRSDRGAKTSVKSNARPSTRTAATAAPQRRISEHLKIHTENWECGQNMVFKRCCEHARISGSTRVPQKARLEDL